MKFLNVIVGVIMKTKEQIQLAINLYQKELSILMATHHGMRYYRISIARLKSKITILKWVLEG